MADGDKEPRRYSVRDVMGVLHAVVNQSSMARRMGWAGSGGGMDKRRDIAEECGFPKQVNDPAEWQRLYDRDGLAARVVEILPKESWQVLPVVYETEDEEQITPFEQGFDGVVAGLRGEHSWFNDTGEGNPLWYYCLLADIVSGIGRYGIVLLGLDDGQPLSQPARSIVEKHSWPVGYEVGHDGKQKPVGTAYVQPSVNAHGEATIYSLATNVDVEPGAVKLRYMRVFPEHLAPITQTETNWTSPRYGQPVMYSVTLNDPTAIGGVGTGMSTATVNVHWSRVLHIADTTHQAPTNEVFAKPRCEPVLNNLLNLQKVFGASGEGYWKACFSLLQFATHAALGGNVTVDMVELKDAVEEAMNGLQRALFGQGGQWSTLAPSMADPTPHIAANIQAICIKGGYPQRIFMGSERGELASSQDDAAWNDRLRQRQRGYTTPRIIVPLIDRLICLRVLPQPTAGKAMVDNVRATEPHRLVRGHGGTYVVNRTGGGAVFVSDRGGYSVWWPDLTSQSDGERATVAAQLVQALVAYVGGGVEAILPPFDFFTKVLKWDAEEVRSVLEGAVQDVAAGDTFTSLPEPEPDRPFDVLPPATDAQPAGNAGADGTEEQSEEELFAEYRDELEEALR